MGGHFGTQVRFSRTGYLAVLAVVSFGIVGFLDDWIKVSHQRSLGLNKRAKFAGQVGCAVLFAELAVHWAHTSTALSFTRVTVPGIDLGQIGWVVFAVLVMVGTSNAVNITDGVDGLAAGASTFCFAVLAIMGYWIFRHVSIYHVLPASAIDLALVAMALAGSCIGFLWWNAAPAKIIMGDTGSLAIGAGLAALCLLLNLDLLLPIIGGLFVMETLSVIAQVVSFRVFHRRIFRMAPIHHHFELLGWPETTVIVRFWVLGGLLSPSVSASSTPTFSRWRSSRDDTPPLPVRHGENWAHVSGVGPPPYGRPPVLERGAGASRDAEPRPGDRAATPLDGAGRRGPPDTGPRAAGLVAMVHELPTGTILTVVVALLCVIGLVMVGSASSVVSISSTEARGRSSSESACGWRSV